LGRAPGLSYKIRQSRIANGIVAPFVEFENGTVNTTADEALGASIQSDGGELREAERFLQVELSATDLPANRIKELASQAGISSRTLRRAADKIGIRRTKAGFQGGWVWQLPETSKVAKTLEDGHAESLDIFGNQWTSSVHAKNWS